MVSLQISKYERQASVRRGRTAHGTVGNTRTGFGSRSGGTATKISRSVYLVNAWAAPNVLATGVVSPQRVWATAISAALTAFVGLALKAGQPAALATTLFVSLGAMQTRRDAIAIIVGVLLVTAMGEPLRRLRLRRGTPKISRMDREETAPSISGVSLAEPSTRVTRTPPRFWACFRRE